MKALGIWRALTVACWLLILALATATGGARAQEPVQVKVGFFVASISNVEPVLGSFDITAYGWSVDPSGSFDPAGQLQVLARRGNIVEVERAVLDSGETYIAFRLTATVDQHFDMRKFPFDTQVLRLSVESELPVRRLMLVPDRIDTAVADFLEINGWQLSNLTIFDTDATYQTEFGHAGGDPRFSRLTLRIQIDRLRSGLAIERFVGFLAALVISGLIYLVPVDQIGVRTGLVTSSIFTAVGNRYGLDAVVGHVGGFGLVDQLTLIVFATLVIGILNTIIVHRLHDSGRSEAARRINRRVGAAMMPASIGLSAAALAWAAL